jgi:hypothetical protein
MLRGKAEEEKEVIPEASKGVKGSRTGGPSERYMRIGSRFRCAASAASFAFAREKTAMSPARVAFSFRVRGEE